MTYRNNTEILALEPYDISTDSVGIAELTTPLPPAPKTAVSARLSQTPELPGQSCREATQAEPGKLRRLEPRARPGRHDVDFG